MWEGELCEAPITIPFFHALFLESSRGSLLYSFSYSLTIAVLLRIDSINKNG